MTAFNRTESGMLAVFIVGVLVGFIAARSGRVLTSTWR